MSKLLIILLISFIGINCIMENKVDLQLYLDSIERGFVGKIGTAVVIFKQKDYPIFFNTKKETCFYSKISDGKNNYNVSCGLIYAFRGIQVYVFCNIEGNVVVVDQIGKHYGPALLGGQDVDGLRAGYICAIDR